MNIEEHYDCINKMKGTSNYFSRWQSIRDVYKPKLDVDLFEEKAQYTPHDYERHCVNIYNILSQIIPQDAYSHTLNAEQLFLLNISVILHDVAMVLNLNDPKMRDGHSEMAKEYIKNEVLARNKSFLSELLTIAEAEFISEIIFGHSDVKENGKTIYKSIELLTKSPKTGVLGKRVDVRLLSALLRLADELDINSDRVKFKHHLAPRIGDNSQPHWRKCDIFTLPNLDDRNKTQINLRIHESLINSDGNFENDILLANEVLKKVRTELKYLNDTVFFVSNITWWHIQSVVIFTEDQAISNALEKKSSNQVISIISQNIEDSKPAIVDKKEDVVESIHEEISINVIDSKFSLRIDNWVKENQLFNSGHYFLTKEMCARDWINTTTLLSTQKYISQIIDKIAQYLSSSIDTGKKYYIIGEGFPGVVLSSTLGYKMQMPFTYVIPQKDFSYHTSEEKNISIPAQSEIILITDAIIYANTIESITNWLKKEHDIENNRIAKIITVFYRQPIAVHEKDANSIKISPTLSSKIFCLNDTFPVEICTKKTCIFKDSNLITHEFDN
jgi:hypothetical protein